MSPATPRKPNPPPRTDPCGCCAPNAGRHHWGNDMKCLHAGCDRAWWYERTHPSRCPSPRARMKAPEWPAISVKDAARAAVHVINEAIHALDRGRTRDLAEIEHAAGFLEDPEGTFRWMCAGLIEQRMEAMDPELVLEALGPRIEAARARAVRGGNSPCGVESDPGGWARLGG